MEKRATEDKMVGWHQQLNGHEFEETLGDSEGQGSQQQLLFIEENSVSYGRELGLLEHRNYE